MGVEYRPFAELGDELCNACADGNLEAILKHLTRLQASDSSYSRPWQALLQMAALKDQARIARFSLDHGAKVNRFVMTAIVSYRSRQTYTYLLDNSVISVNHIVPWAGDVLSQVVYDDDYNWTKLCLDKGADPNKYKTEDHKSVLAVAPGEASVKVVELLLRYGAIMRNSGAIVIAAEEGRLEMVEYLLEKGASINEIGNAWPGYDPGIDQHRKDMGSALHKAVIGGHEAVVRFLIDNEAELHLEDPMRRTPLMLAQAKQDSKMVKLLEEHGAWRSGLLVDIRIQMDGYSYACAPATLVWGSTTGLPLELLPCSSTVRTLLLILQSESRGTQTIYGCDFTVIGLSNEMSHAPFVRRSSCSSRYSYKFW